MKALFSFLSAGLFIGGLAGALSLLLGDDVLAHLLVRQPKPTYTGPNADLKGLERLKPSTTSRAAEDDLSSDSSSSPALNAMAWEPMLASTEPYSKRMFQRPTPPPPSTTTTTSATEANRWLPPPPKVVVTDTGSSGDDETGGSASESGSGMSYSNGGRKPTLVRRGSSDSVSATSTGGGSGKRVTFASTPEKDDNRSMSPSPGRRKFGAASPVRRKGAAIRR